MLSKLYAGFGVAVLALALAVPANAHDCTVAKKPARAGAVGVVDIATEQFTPLKKNPGTEERPHGAFIAIEGDGVATSTFAHAPGGVMPPVREGGPHDNCDGKGLDSLEQCFGG
jgi:hypothetical protein